MKMFLIITLISLQANSNTMCEVEVCNKIERISLNLWSHINDAMGETCFNIVLPKNKAKPNEVLDSKSKWFQGSSVNVTKKSVTRVKRVIKCESDYYGN